MATEEKRVMAEASWSDMTSVRKWVLFVATLFGTVITWWFFDSMTQNVFSPLILSTMPDDTKKHRLLSGHTIETGKFVSTLVVYLVLLVLTVGIAWAVRQT